jgi:hypothetical protein
MFARILEVCVRALGSAVRRPPRAANDARRLTRLAAENGFDVRRLIQIEGKPTSLAWHPLAYRAGIAYERVVNRFQSAARFRANLLVDLEARSGARARP